MESNVRSLEERRQAAMESLEARREALAVANIPKPGSVNYLEDPNLKSFNKKLRNKGFEKARKPIKLGTVEETALEIQDYFNLCEKYAQLPSLKSLCLYLGISVTTYNSYAKDMDSEYGDLFRASVDFIHSVIENGAMNNKINPATYMFTASNFYGMRDSKHIDVSAVAPTNNTTSSSRESINELRRQIEHEKNGDAIDADFVEKFGDISE